MNVQLFYAGKYIHLPGMEVIPRKGEMVVCKEMGTDRSIYRVDDIEHIIGDEEIIIVIGLK